MRSWAVKREDGEYLLSKNGAIRLFKTRVDAVAVAARTKGKAKVQRVEVTDA